jgi:hypothetical protein
MKKTLWFISLIIFVCASSLTMVWAEEKKPVVKKEAAPILNAKEKAEYSKKVDLFIQLASYGETNKDPLVTLSAVKMLDELPFTGIVKPGEPEKGGARYEREALLNQAKQFAADDQELLAVIAKVQNPPEKIAVRGRHDGRGDYGGRDFGPGHYYGRPHHERNYGCNWIRICRHGDCNLICR